VEGQVDGEQAGDRRLAHAERRTALAHRPSSA
jgi:hypothetical protein